MLKKIKDIGELIAENPIRSAFVFLCLVVGIVLLIYVPFMGLKAIIFAVTVLAVTAAIYSDID